MTDQLFVYIVAQHPLTDEKVKSVFNDLVERHEHLVWPPADYSPRVRAYEKQEGLPLGSLGPAIIYRDEICFEWAIVSSINPWQLDERIERQNTLWVRAESCTNKELIMYWQEMPDLIFSFVDIFCDLCSSLNATFAMVGHDVSLIDIGHPGQDDCTDSEYLKILETSGWSPTIETYFLDMVTVNDVTVDVLKQWAGIIKRVGTAGYFIDRNDLPIFGGWHPDEEVRTAQNRIFRRDILPRIQQRLIETGND